MVSSREELQQRFDQLMSELTATADLGLTDEFAAQIQRVRQQLEGHCEVSDDPEEVWHGMIGVSEPMMDLRAKIEKFAVVTSAVMITGESGTGKDLIARILHELSPRRQKPMVSENCAAIPETLLESVLFGHKRGSFTGAIKDHPGHFVAADKGTLFLDEIGDMSLSMQSKLLRTLQEGEVRAVGSEKVRKVDVRVLAATNRNLESMVAAGQFRQDLYYRLNVLVLHAPPLRERGDDVVRIARWLLTGLCAAAGRKLTLSNAALKAISAFSWPGNIRQLQNELQRLVALCSDPVVGLADLSPVIIDGTKT